MARALIATLPFLTKASRAAAAIDQIAPRSTRAQMPRAAPPAPRTHAAGRDERLRDPSRPPRGRRRWLLLNSLAPLSLTLRAGCCANSPRGNHYVTKTTAIWPRSRRLGRTFRQFSPARRAVAEFTTLGASLSAHTLRSTSRTRAGGHRPAGRYRLARALPHDVPRRSGRCADRGLAPQRN